MLRPTSIQLVVFGLSTGRRAAVQAENWPGSVSRLHPGTGQRRHRAAAGDRAGQDPGSNRIRALVHLAV